MSACQIQLVFIKVNFSSPKKSFHFIRFSPSKEEKKEIKSEKMVLLT